MKRIPVEETFSWQKPIKEILTEIPVSPAKADRYILNTQIAWYDGSNWQYDTPEIGWAVLNLNDFKKYLFNGVNWIAYESILDVTEAIDDVDTRIAYAIEQFNLYLNDVIFKGWQLVGSWDWTEDIAQAIFPNLEGYNDILVFIIQVTADAPCIRTLRVSDDNGDSFYDSAGDYIDVDNTGSETFVDEINTHSVSSASGRTSITQFINWNNEEAIGKLAIAQNNTDPIFRLTMATKLNALAVIGSGGNFTAGSIRVYGR